MKVIELLLCPCIVMWDGKSGRKVMETKKIEESINDIVESEYAFPEIFKCLEEYWLSGIHRQGNTMTLIQLIGKCVWLSS